MTPDWLSRYVDHDTGIRAKSAVWPGWGQRIVTDYHCVLAVADPTATFAEPEIWQRSESPVPRQDNLRRLLHEPVPPSAMVCDLLDLWAWLDRLDMSRCTPCRGTGEGWAYDTQHNAILCGPSGACSECDGKGWVIPIPDEPADSDTVSICGLPIDRNMLVRWLAGELEERGTRVAIWRTDVKEAMCVTFDGGQWRLIAAGLAQDYHPARYRQYLPGAGAWWQHRKCPTARLVASDWAGERGADVFDVFGTHEGIA